MMIIEEDCEEENRESIRNSTNIINYDFLAKNIS